MNRKHTIPYDHRINYNRVKCSTASGKYCTAQFVNVPFCIPEFSSRKIISHQFHVANDEGDSGIGYVMVIGPNLMVQLGLMSDFKIQFIQWDSAEVTMKDPSGLLGKYDLSKHEIRKVFMQTAELASTKEANEILVEILESNY